VGDKILLYRSSESEHALFDLNWNKVVVLRSDCHVGRGYALNIHRLGKSPEHYSGGGGLGNTPCPAPYDTCAAELERYVLGATTTEVLCPNESCNEGSLGQCIYDSKTKKLICGTMADGNKLYLVDPETKSFVKWPARGAQRNSHREVQVVAIHNGYVYIVITTPDLFAKLYRIKVDDFYDVFGKDSIEDHAEYVMDLGANMPFRETGFVYNKKVYLWSGALDLDKLTITSYSGILKRYLGTKYAINFGSRAVVDLDTLASVQAINLPDLLPADYVEAYYIDSIFYVGYEESGANMYVYYITYKGYVPAVDYDPATRKFRVIDLITKSPITAKVRIYWSRFAYPIQSDAPDAEVQELTVSDWTGIPSPPAGDQLVANIRIWDVVG
jgi:hypothetical protein